jgi:hypothetical protein
MKSSAEPETGRGRRKDLPKNLVAAPLPLASSEDPENAFVDPEDTFVDLLPVFADRGRCPDGGGQGWSRWQCLEPVPGK